MKKDWKWQRRCIMLSLATGVFAQATKGAAPPSSQGREGEDGRDDGHVQAIDLNTRMSPQGTEGGGEGHQGGEEAVNLPRSRSAIS